MATGTNEELKEIWAEFRALIKKKYSLSNLIMRLWFDDAELTLLTDEEAVINVSDALKKGVLDDHYTDQMLETFGELLGAPIKKITVYSTAVHEKALEKHREYVKNHPGDYIEDPETNVADVRAINNAELSFIQTKTFDNFIEGKSNEFALLAAKALSQKPGKIYNPFFVYGPSGVGKTHLLLAIANRIKENFPQYKKIIYIKGEEFTNQLVAALGKGKTPEFRDTYRTADVLIIDDIQFFANKRSTQEEFFHTFNDLYENGKQIVLASDRPPKDLDDFENRLKTRFESGLTADITKPDYELRLAVVKQKMLEIDLKIADEAIPDFLARNLMENIRQIEGSVKKLKAIYTLSGKPAATMDMAIKCVSEKIVPAEPTAVTKDRIINLVCKKYSVTFEELKSKSRTASLSYARHIACWLMKKYAGMSLPAIGSVFGRDHSTVINSIDAVEKKMAEDSAFAADIDYLVNELKG